MPVSVWVIGSTAQITHPADVAHIEHHWHHTAQSLTALQPPVGGGYLAPSLAGINTGILTKKVPPAAQTSAPKKIPACAAHVTTPHPGRDARPCLLRCASWLHDDFSDCVTMAMAMPWPVHILHYACTGAGATRPACNPCICAIWRICPVLLRWFRGLWTRCGTLCTAHGQRTNCNASCAVSPCAHVHSSGAAHELTDPEKPQRGMRMPPTRPVLSAMDNPTSFESGRGLG